jgi:hydrogenase maturation protease
VSTLVAGIGSPFGDDRVGWEVVAALKAALPEPAAIRTLTLDRPGAALVNALHGVQHAIIVDAAQDAHATPGTLRWLAPSAIEASNSASSHGFGLAEALALARALDAAPARIEVLAVCAQSYDGEELSENVRAAVPRAVEEILARVAASVRGHDDLAVTT